MSSQTSVAVPSLGTTLGVLYIGVTIGAMQVGFVSAYVFTDHHSSFFGITNTQVATFYKKYPDDWWIFRYSVRRPKFAVFSLLVYQVGTLWYVRACLTTKS